LKANYQARPDVLALLKEARKSGNTPAGNQVLEQLIANADIAASKALPLCQDCGYVTVFAEVGQDVVFDGPFETAVQAGVGQGYEQGYLRKSVIQDALTERVRPEVERPANIYVTLVPGDSLKLTVMPKGGGSDNASRMAMLRPTAGVDEIVGFIVEAVAVSGAAACPPLFVGVGIGGSFDSVGLLAKKALLRDFRRSAQAREARELEARLLADINELRIGPGGLGGAVTALGVAVATDRTHIACLPVAVNLSCNQLRSASGEL